MAEVINVTTGKPKVGGAISEAPAGTTLPTDATSALANAFVNFGYVSEDGLTNSNTAENEQTVAWGGDVVMDTMTSKPDQFTYTLIEATNVDALKHVYGSSNVSGTLTTGIVINANSTEQAEKVIVIDMVLRGPAVKRIVIPRGKVLTVGDIVYNDTDPVGYEVTLAAYPDASGNTHYEYIKKSS